MSLWVITLWNICPSKIEGRKNNIIVSFFILIIVANGRLSAVADFVNNIFILFTIINASSNAEAKEMQAIELSQC